MVEARANVESLAHALGFLPDDVTHVATAISYLARVILENAGAGQIVLAAVDQTHRRGIVTIGRSAEPAGDQYWPISQRLWDLRMLVDELTISESGRRAAVMFKKWHPSDSNGRNLARAAG